MSEDTGVTPPAPEAGAVVKADVKAKEVEPQIIQYNPDDPVALYMQPTVFMQLQRVARLMASSGLVPVHLQSQYRDGKVITDKTSDCFLVAAQAFRWRMDPFAVAQCSFVLSGKLGYEGKLIAAVINASPRLAVSLNYEYTGAENLRKVRVFATLRGEEKPREVFGTVSEWQTQNPKWKTMTDQMLAYRGAREWARRHMPEAVLGVYADEEVEEIAARPQTFIATPDSLTMESMTGTQVLTVSAVTSPEAVQAQDDGKPTPTPAPAQKSRPARPTKPEKAPTPPAPAPQPAPPPVPPAPEPAPAPEPVEIEDEPEDEPEDVDDEVRDLFK